MFNKRHISKIFVYFISLIFVTFSLFSFVSIGINNINISIFIFGALQALVAIKYFNLIAMFAAFEYFILGLVIFFWVAFGHVDNQDSLFKEFTFTMRFVLGAIVFIALCFVSSFILKRIQIKGVRAL